VIPFFSKRNCKRCWIASSNSLLWLPLLKFNVVNLEEVLKTLQTGRIAEPNYANPTTESIEFVRLLQPAPLRIKPTQATPSKASLPQRPLVLTHDWSTAGIGFRTWQWRTVASCAAIAADVLTAEVDWLLQDSWAGSTSPEARVFQRLVSDSAKTALKELDLLWQQRLHERLPVQYIAGFAPWRNF